MSDREIIAWARDWADQLAGARQFTQEEKYRRLADLAEKGAEDWQDATTTHPKDDRDVLLLVGSKRHIGYFSHIGFIWCIDGLEARPTHWRPITYPEQKPPPSHPVQIVRWTAELVLTGLVKGGEYASPDAWAARVGPDVALCLAADGRLVSFYSHACEAETRGAMPISWYTYTSPKPSRTSDPG